MHIIAPRAAAALQPSVYMHPYMEAYIYGIHIRHIGHTYKANAYNCPTCCCYSAALCLHVCVRARTRAFVCVCVCVCGVRACIYIHTS